MSHFVINVASAGLSDEEREVLQEGYLRNEGIRFDRIANEPDAEVLESLLEKALLRRMRQALGGYYEHYRLTRKGKKLALTLIRLTRVV